MSEWHVDDEQTTCAHVGSDGDTQTGTRCADESGWKGSARLNGRQPVYVKPCGTDRCTGGLSREKVVFLRVFFET